MHAGNTIQHEAQHRQQHGQHDTYVWVNAVDTGNAILMYGSTRSTQATPYLCMGQRGQHRLVS